MGRPLVRIKAKEFSEDSWNPLSVCYSFTVVWHVMFRHAPVRLLYFTKREERVHCQSMKTVFVIVYVTFPAAFDLYHTAVQLEAEDAAGCWVGSRRLWSCRVVMFTPSFEVDEVSA